jgi:hypothetical protein
MVKQIFNFFELHDDVIFLQVKIVLLFMMNIDVHRLLSNQVIPMLHNMSQQMVIKQQLMNKTMNNNVHDVQVLVMHPLMSNYRFKSLKIYPGKAAATVVSIAQFLQALAKEMKSFFFLCECIYDRIFFVCI